MLDLLADQIEVDDYKEQRKQEVKEMNKIMDERLKIINESKQKQQEKELVKAIDEAKEENSGIMLRKGTRKLK